MKRIALTVWFILSLTVPLSAQVNYPNLAAYCRAISETSSTILQARIDGISRADAEGLIMESGMTDPVSIRLVKEAIQFAYSRPASSDIDALRAELRSLCMAKKIFVQ